MLLRDLLAWTAGIGSLLYCVTAFLKPDWFLADPVEPEPSSHNWNPSNHRRAPVVSKLFKAHMR